MRPPIPLAALLLSSTLAASASPLPADAVAAATGDPRLVVLLLEVLEQNPNIAVARARLRAAESRPAQAGARPDPVAGVTAFLLRPETRVGPQVLALSLSQRFPGFGRLGLAERAAVEDGVAAGARLEEARLAAVTEARRWYYELAFHDEHESILRKDIGLLRQFEELARSRYAAGNGLQAAPLQLQALLTRLEVERLRLEQARATALAALNSLRGAEPSTPVGASALPQRAAVPADLSLLADLARSVRPALASAETAIVAAGTRVELARRGSKPSFTVGASYTLVADRQDPGGRANPPRDDGDDILAVSTAIQLPVRRRALAAAVEEAVARQEAARQERRALLAALDRDLTDLATRVRLLTRQLSLFEDLLLVQAEAALHSVETAYSSGSVGALDLLDSTRVLYDVELSAARTRADRAIAFARLEGTIGAPLPPNVAELSR